MTLRTFPEGYAAARNVLVGEAARLARHEGPVTLDQVAARLIERRVGAMDFLDALRFTTVPVMGDEIEAGALLVAEWALGEADRHNPGALVDHGDGTWTYLADEVVWAPGSPPYDVSQGLGAVVAGAREIMMARAPYDYARQQARRQLPERWVLNHDVQALAAALRLTAEGDEVTLDRPIVVDQNGRIVDGNLRAKALGLLGLAWNADWDPQKPKGRFWRKKHFSSDMDRLLYAVALNAGQRPLTMATIREIAGNVDVPEEQRENLIALMGAMAGLQDALDELRRRRAWELWAMTRGQVPPELAEFPRASSRGRPPIGARPWGGTFTQEVIGQILGLEFDTEPVPQQTVGYWLAAEFTNPSSVLVNSLPGETSVEERPPTPSGREVLALIEGAGSAGRTRPELIAEMGRDRTKELTRLARGGHVVVIDEGRTKRYFTPEHAPPEATLEPTVASTAVDATVCNGCCPVHCR